MSGMFEKLSSMLNGKEIPPDMQNIVQNLTSNLNSSNQNSENQNNSNSNSPGFNSSNSNSSNSNSSESNFGGFGSYTENKKEERSNSDSGSAPEFDINMIMKMKTIMDSMKSNKNDPRANLLRSLKPYLNSNRKEKVDQYIQLFNMSKVFEVMNPPGGDKKK